MTRTYRLNIAEDDFQRLLMQGGIRIEFDEETTIEITLHDVGYDAMVKAIQRAIEG